MEADARPSTDVGAIAWLVERVPELRGLLDEHVAYYDEILSYVVLEGDFLRWFVDRVRAGDRAPARRFVAALEPLLTTDVVPQAVDRVWNLVSVAVVEGLVMDDADDVVGLARPWMGPKRHAPSTT